jgi:hypothetical protein
MTTPMPTGFNDHHVWKGPPYAQELLNGPMITASSQVGIHASNSDDLFFPSNNVVPSLTYTLPDILSNTTYSCSYSHHPSNHYIPVNRAHLSQPIFPPAQPNTFTSYNNPEFVPPPSTSRSLPHTPNNNNPQPQPPVEQVATK